MMKSNMSNSEHIMQVMTTKNRVLNKLRKPQQHKTEGFKYITQAMATQNRVLNTLQRPWQHMTEGFKHIIMQANIWNTSVHRATSETQIIYIYMYIYLKPN